MKMIGLCGKPGMEGAAAVVVVVGADGSETSFTFDALVHSEDGERACGPSQ